MKDLFQNPVVDLTTKNVILEKAQNWHDAISGWFCVLLVAMCTGITAGFIDVAVKVVDLYNEVKRGHIHIQDGEMSDMLRIL